MAVVVMLWGTTTAFADTSAHAFTQTQNTYDFDQDEAGFSIIVTVAGQYDWSYSLYASAWVGSRGTDPAGSSAQSLGTATVSGIASDSVYATISISDVCGTHSDNDSASDSGTQWMIVGDDLTFDELSAAYAAVGDGAMQASAKGNTTASGSIQ